MIRTGVRESAAPIKLVRRLKCAFPLVKRSNFSSVFLGILLIELQ